MRGNPGKRRLNRDEPQPGGAPICPSWLPQRARMIWAARAPELVRIGVLTSADEETFADFCWWGSEVQRLVRLQTRRGDAGARKRGITSDLRKASELMRRAAGKFGLTASDRTQLHVVPPAPQTDEDFIFGRPRGTRA